MTFCETICILYILHEFSNLEPSHNCQGAYEKGAKETSVLPIYIPGMDFVYVKCDMVTDGGG